MATGYPHFVHAQGSAARFRIAVSLFRLITGIPFFAGFIFGLVRDSWNPFGWRDPGYFRIFVPLTMIALAGGAFSRTTYTGLVLGMLFTTISYSFIAAAFQGLLALIGQEALMPGRLSTLSNVFISVAAVLGYLASGWMSTELSPRQVFLFVMAIRPSLVSSDSGSRAPSSAKPMTIRTHEAAVF